MYVYDLPRRGQPEELAIVDHGRRFRYRDFQEAVACCRDWLAAEGVRPGARVGIFSRNSAEYLFAFFGIVSLGAIAVPINFQLSNREIAFIIKDAGIRHLLTYQPLNLVDAFSQLRYDAKLRQYDIKGAGQKRDVPTAPPLPDAFDEGQPAMIIYTSGTTGNPKGAVLSHANLIANCEQLTVSGCQAKDNVLAVLPMYHAYGWSCAVLETFYTGATCVVLDRFTPKETVNTIRDEKITHLYFVPSICSLLTKLAKHEDMATLSFVCSAGTTLPVKIAQDFIDKYGVEICECYGLSETSPVLTMNPPGKSKVGSVGPILKGMRWRLVDAHGDDVPRGEAGELIVKGPTVMLGYWNQPEVTAVAMRGGWFHTSDIARVDADGYFYIVDRIKDMIISMGENIYPREIEELIYQFPGIAEAAVVGIEDKIRGQAGACFYSVHPDEHVSIRALKKFLQDNLALYKIPREFHEMEHLPRTATGKILKRAILKEFLEQKAINKQ